MGNESLEGEKQASLLLDRPGLRDVPLGVPETQGSRSGLQRMRRCFMTGKQCIFSLAGEADLRNQNKYLTCPSVFVVMPFRPLLDTFFEWSLKPYLQYFGYRDEQIRRADKDPDIGYIMCEKICRRIQEASLVVVDLSLDNPNVYYELGISVGLGKPLLFICEETAQKESKDEKWKAVGIDKQKIISFPGVGFLNGESHPLSRHTTSVPLGPRKQEMQLVALLVPDALHVDSSHQDDIRGHPRRSPRGQGAGKASQRDDIPVSFHGALQAAVGVAISSIMKKAGDSAEKAGGDRFAAELSAAVASFSDRTRQKLRTCSAHDLYGSKGVPLAYKEIAEAVDASFACVIDLARETPLSYFWLGYCHARNVNVIPIFREMPALQSAASAESAEYDIVRESQNTGEERGGSIASQGRVERRHGNLLEKRGGYQVLAFDIRALWYMPYNDEDPRTLASTLQGILEELLVKDVTTQQRRILWGRLTRKRNVYIYTGAVHHKDLNREMVGDWDLRAVSELVRYLSSSEETAVPVFERPIYAPETIEHKLSDKSVTWDAAHEAEYVKLIKEELAEKSCLIVASPDVNPMTEVVLAYAYGKGRDPGSLCFSEPDALTENRVVVGLKPPGRVDSLKRHFSRIKINESEKLPEKCRGFLVDGKALLKPYKSQDEADEGPFTVLAHLLIMRNPFSKKEPRDDMIVLLNGISGPGTFGLAEVLTGGTTPSKAAESEKLLRQINETWDRDVEVKESYNGVEAIVEVRIEPASEPESPGHTGQGERGRGVVDTFYDKRKVENWGLYTEYKMLSGNPRAIPL